MLILDSYSENREKVRSGDLLLWKSYTLVGWLIRFFTGHNENHSDFAIRPEKLGHFRDRRFSLGAEGNGVLLRLLSERLRHFKGKLWLYPLKDEFNGDRDKIITCALECEGIGYDYYSLFKQILGRVSVDADKYFCSEFCYDIYRKAGLPVPELEHAPRPGDLKELKIFDKPIFLYERRK